MRQVGLKVPPDIYGWVKSAVHKARHLTLIISKEQENQYEKQGESPTTAAEKATLHICHLKFPPFL